jgi:hypothetical protein
MTFTILSALSTFYFVFWVGGAALSAIGFPLWTSTVVASLGAGAVGRYVWRRTESAQMTLGKSIVLGAIALGSLGFAGGFWGPIYFTPDANQGPLLGIFFTGPLGFVLGAVGGGIYWAIRGGRVARTPGA